MREAFGSLLLLKKKHFDNPDFPLLTFVYASVSIALPSGCAATAQAAGRIAF